MLKLKKAQLESWNSVELIERQTLTNGSYSIFKLNQVQLKIELWWGCWYFLVNCSQPGYQDMTAKFGNFASDPSVIKDWNKIWADIRKAKNILISRYKWPHNEAHIDKLSIFSIIEKKCFFKPVFRIINTLIRLSETSPWKPTFAMKIWKYRELLLQTLLMKL